MKTIVIIMLGILPALCTAQGGIEHIRNQPCMKYASSVDCDNQDGDNLSARICANLRYQKSDSLLQVVQDKLLLQQRTDSAKQVILRLQKQWRFLRDEHCGLIWEKWVGGSSHLRAIHYLDCLTLMTDNRRKELEALIGFSDE